LSRGRIWILMPFKLLILFYLQIVIVSASELPTLVFAPLPMKNKETIYKTFAPLTNYLSQTLHVNIQYDFSDSYEILLDKIANGKVDIAYLGPLPYVTLRQYYPFIIPLVHFKEASGEASYTCSIIGWNDDIKALTTMRHATIALTDPLSTCGYLSTEGLLNQKHNSLENNYYHYVKKHDEVALEIIRGNYQYGGIKTAIAKQYQHLGIHILTSTSALPGFAMIADAKRLSPDKIEHLQQALLHTNQIDKTTWGGFIKYGCIEAKDQDYNALRALAKGVNIQPEGNF